MSTPSPTPSDDPLDLLREWFEWWQADGYMPRSMPKALHVRTALAIAVAEGKFAQQERARKSARESVRAAAREQRMKK